MDDSNQSAVEKTVREFIGKNPAVKSNHVEMDMSLKDLNIDSLEKLSIGMDLEDEYSIEFTDEEIEEFATVSDVVLSCLAETSSELIFTLICTVGPL